MPDRVRRVETSRETGETRIQLSLDADGRGEYAIATGIGFFDHMLQSFARHSAMDLRIAASGDLHVDTHHTIEDTGIVLGEAVRQALCGEGGYDGLTRFGTAVIPMDETLVRASVDLCNRPYLVWNVAFVRDRVGDVDTQMFGEFFHAFATNARICLHVDKLRGENSHHIAEACFKALGRALRQAKAPDTLLDGAASSTKGVL